MRSKFLVDSFIQLIYCTIVTCRWEDIVNKYEDGLFCTELDSFPDNIDKLTHCQINWY